MAVRLNTGLRNGILDSGLNGALGADARINVYTGAQPATADLAPSGTLLATLSMAATAFGAAAAGAAAAAAIASDTAADNSGTAGWARIYKAAQGAGVSDVNPHMDVDVGQGAGTLSFDNAVFVAGGTVAISSFTVTLPAG